MKGNKEKRLELFEAGVWFNLTAGLLCDAFSQNGAIMLILMSRRKSAEKCSITTFE